MIKKGELNVAVCPCGQEKSGYLAKVWEWRGHKAETFPGGIRGMVKLSSDEINEIIPVLALVTIIYDNEIAGVLGRREFEKAKSLLETTGRNFQVIDLNQLKSEVGDRQSERRRKERVNFPWWLYRD